MLITPGVQIPTDISSLVFAFNSFIKDVIFEGLASDGGLYIPESWPSLSKGMINSFSSMTYQEIAYEVISPYIDSSLTEKNLKL